MVGRLAPSPTGALHLGNARTFLMAWLSVRSRKGVLLCRVEDLDGPRVRKGAVEETLEDLGWLGLSWDGEVQLQSLRKDRYQLALAHLRERGLVYPCVCTRSEIERAQSAPQEALDHGTPYPGTCRGLFASAEEAWAETGRGPAWRFRLPEKARVGFEDGFHGHMSFDLGQICGDFVVAKRDGEAAYQLAVVVDDGDFGVNEVLRGDDLADSTARQILLYRALGLPEPRWIHLPLVVGPDGRRLAKRHGDTRISGFRRRGLAPGEVTGFLARASGLVSRPGPLEPRDLCEGFDLSEVPPEPLRLERDPWA